MVAPGRRFGVGRVSAWGVELVAAAGPRWWAPHVPAVTGRPSLQICGWAVCGDIGVAIMLARDVMAITTIWRGCWARTNMHAYSFQDSVSLRADLCGCDVRSPVSNVGVGSPNFLLSRTFRVEGLQRADAGTVFAALAVPRGRHLYR